MARYRADRDSSTREAETRANTWKPPSVLPDPNPVEGWRYRWVRTSMLGNADNQNVSIRMREGWEPVKAEEVPELMLRTDPRSEYKGNVEVGGLLLCKAPVEVADGRQRYYEDLAARQLQSVDNNIMREQDSRMPILPSERRSRVTFGRGGDE